MVLGGIIAGSVYCSASEFANPADVSSLKHLLQWIKAWGRNGFDGIESLWRGVPGSELP